MKHSFRLALLVCASCVGLAFAGPALAAYTPSLTIEQTSYKVGAPFTADLFIAASDTDDPSAKLTIFSPVGYGVNLTKTPGTKVGSAVALAKIGALGGANLPLAGDVVVANPADPTLMATWGAAVTALHSMDVVTFGSDRALPFSIGVCSGISTWFAVLLKFLKRAKARFGRQTLDRTVRVMGVLLALLGLFFGVRFVLYFRGQ